MKPDMDGDDLERPRLRPLEAFPVASEEGTVYCLRDPGGDSEATLMLSPAAIWLLGKMDGLNDLAGLQAEFYRASGEFLGREQLQSLIGTLEQAAFLDSESFRARVAREARQFHEAATRPAAFAGASYPSDPVHLRSLIDDQIARGKGLAPGPRLRACLAPHIDPDRGGSVYGSAYRPLAGASPRRIVVLGVSHSGSDSPYVLLDKDYETPLGACRVDSEFVSALVAGLPFDPLEERIRHRREHSIEFQAVYLQQAIANPEDCRIVPILCGFPWTPEDRQDLLSYPETWRAAFVRRLAGMIDDDTVVVAGVDFAHVGARFGDERSGVASIRASVEEADRAMMSVISSGDARAFRGVIDRESDRRRICGFPAILTLLEILPDSIGASLDYGQSVNESVDSLVSYGAMAFA